jgi:hypothetical protein
MDYRKIALRVLFASLIIAALAGVAALLLPSSTYLIGKLIGTAFATAATAALLLISLKVLENPHHKLVGTTVAAVVCFVYLTGIGAIWTDNSFFFSKYDISEKLAVTSLLGASCGILIIIGAAMQARERLRLAGKIFMSIWLFVFLAWVINNWMFSYNPHLTKKVIYTVAPLQSYSVPLAIMFVAREKRYRVVGVILTLLACLCVQYGLLSTDGSMQERHGLLRVALLLSWLSALMAIWVVLTYRAQKYAIVWAERCTVVLVGIAFTLFSYLIWLDIITNQAKPPDILSRLGASLGILASTAVLGLLVWQMIRANLFLRQSKGNLDANCPRCHAPLSIPQGKSTCLNCGLGMQLQLEAPNCRKCHYDLSGNSTSAVCPECGEPIALTSSVE